MSKAGPHRRITPDGEDFAIFSGDPLFARPRTTGQLANRDPDKFLALAHGAFERRWLSNQGPLVRELEERLAQMHGTAHCVAFANACFAIILALANLRRADTHKVLLPSLTFRGLPHLIRWAGLEPEYCDVDPATHALSVADLKPRLGPDVAAVLAVDNVNSPCDIDAIEREALRTGTPVLLDSVYAVGGSYGSDLIGARGAASVFSLHATKLINGFEGGYLTTNDDALARALRSQRTFGFGPDGVPHGLGLNAKLNEIHAAMALSNLPYVASIIADNFERFAAYRRAFAGIDWVGFADYGAPRSNYGLVLLEVRPGAPLTRDQLIGVLRAENALVRPYYAPPLHVSDPLGARGVYPISEDVATRFIQMPVGDGVSLTDIEQLAELFEAVERRGPEIAARLQGRA